MPIEIKELLIRAFVTEQNNDSENEVAPIVKEMNSAQDTLTMVANMIKQEKER
jgi:Family of unknown function (DUF5908)